MSLVILSAAIPFSASFVPAEVRDRSTSYVQITAFTAFSSALEAAVSASTRALDRPDVPLVLSAIKFSLNIVLDLLLISTFHVGKHEPTVNLQAIIQLACNISAALGGLAYFIRQQQRASLHKPGEERAGPSFSGLRDLIRPGTPTFVESAIRNTLYLWVVSNIISLGSIYATAWGVFTSIRWGLVMVPVQALEATTLTFVGHNWGLFKCHVEIRRGPVAFNSSQLSQVIRPAFVSVALALAFEIPLCLFLSYFGVRPFAYFLSRNDEVADVTAHMWRSIDWCYVLYGVSTQLAAILLATKPSWYLGQSLASNLLYVLPWAIICQVANLNTDNAWTYHAFVFGGSLVFSFVCVLLILVRWAWVVTRSAARI